MRSANSVPPTLLCILDGFGLNPNSAGNAIALARKPHIDKLMHESPNSTLVTFGERVGLPEGVMGNSEVGHLNIGAGRVVEQWLLKINRSFDQGAVKTIPAYLSFISSVQSSPTIHLIGLYGDGGVHSHYEHLFRLIEQLLKDTNSKIALHIITDGRDTGPMLAASQLARLVDFINSRPRCSIVSISGRYFAMDRDKRWERTENAYQAIALGTALSVKDPLAYLEHSYNQSIGDEFIEPRCVISNDLKTHKIEESDAIVFWNFRADRMRQLVGAMTQPSFKQHSSIFKGPLVNPAKLLCFTDYDSSYKLPYLFSQISITNHLGQVLERQKLKQIRIAETEKYPHVTYFFNGGVEQPCTGEDRKMAQSPRDVKTYDLKPEMSAAEVASLVIDAINAQQYSLIVLNFANCDMVGHTGVLSAAIKAVETVDTHLGEILEQLQKHNGQALIIADHGNAEQMINYQDGTPHTAHTTYPVPVILWNYKDTVTLRTTGALCDVAPTLLEMLAIDQPDEMTGRSLICR